MQQLELVPYLLYEKEDNGILWIKFNRPEKLNAAVGGPERAGTLSKVGEYMRAGDDDPDVKVIVLSGVGRGFCAGVDIRGSDLGQFAPGDNFLGSAPYEAGGLDATRQGFYHGMTKLMKDLSYIRKPTIAMVNGVAAGLGMDMALQCDIRYGSEHARFISYHLVGQMIEHGGAYVLTRLIGLGRALEFSFTGDLDGPTAAEWGVLNRLVPAEDLEAEVRALCDRIMRNPPLVSWINKRVIRTAADTTLEHTAVLTSSASPIPGTSEDAAEARSALRERREPVFKGR